MRKIDYALLAQLIKTEIEFYAPLRTDGAKGARDCAAHIAIQFAREASVNHNEFLLACGINPQLATYKRATG